MGRKAKELPDCLEIHVGWRVGYELDPQEQNAIYTHEVKQRADDIETHKIDGERLAIVPSVKRWVVDCPYQKARAFDLWLGTHVDLIHEGRHPRTIKRRGMIRRKLAQADHGIRSDDPRLDRRR